MDDLLEVFKWVCPKCRTILECSNPSEMEVEIHKHSLTHQPKPKIKRKKKGHTLSF